MSLLVCNGGKYLFDNVNARILLLELRNKMGKELRLTGDLTMLKDNGRLTGIRRTGAGAKDKG